MYSEYLLCFEQANTLWTAVVTKLSTKSLTSGYDLSNMRALVYSGTNFRTPVMTRFMNELTGIQTVVQGK